METINSIKVSPLKIHYLVSTLDSTIRIYFCDSDKLFLAIYGHKMPITSFDLSTDGYLLATGSADKDLKIWGMDFGNCLKSIFAHNEPITAVEFVKDTHYLFTAGKDGKLKYWDIDTYQLIL